LLKTTEIKKIVAHLSMHIVLMFKLRQEMPISVFCHPHWLFLLMRRAQVPEECICQADQEWPAVQLIGNLLHSKQARKMIAKLTIKIPGGRSGKIRVCIYYVLRLCAVCQVGKKFLARVALQIM
jgi:hypothetical protein